MLFQPLDTDTGFVANDAPDVGNVSAD